MVARRALSAAGCGHCRSSVLKLFTTGPTSTASISRLAAAARSAPSLSIAPSGSAPTAYGRRQFSSSTPADDAAPAGQQQPQHVDSNTARQAQDEAEDLDESQESNADDTPWYLQVEPPRHVAQIEPEPLPEVPEGAPAIVEILLKYASEEMGLHDISLLDLRELDPPAALGPNLFMLFGSARSERHLNVSAGRLRRWLRHKHRIYADADGLLGPNERKTKLRRKAKRARLLGTMGTDDADDGLRTGWVCVNLGTINRGGADDQGAVIGSDGRVAGFGVSNFGSSVVFQIMTESQRAEMDLESLWKKALDPSAVSEKPSQMHTIEAAPVSGFQALENAFPSNTPSRPSPRQKGKFASPHGPASFFSTTRSIRATASISPHDLLRPDADMLGLDPLQTNLSQLMKSDATQKRRVLDLLRARLDLCTGDQVRSALGHTSDGQVTTPFLELFSEASQFLPSDQTWAHRLAMLTKAVQSRHTGFIAPFGEIGTLIDEMRTNAIDISRQQFLQLLTCVSAMGSQSDDLFMQVLTTMHQRGLEVIAWDVIATMGSTPLSPAGRRTSSGQAKTLRPLIMLAQQKKLPCPDESTLKSLMSSGDGPRLLWAMRLPAQYGRRCSPELYQHFLQCASTIKSPRICAAAALKTMKWMATEKPKVQVDRGFIYTLMKCIRIADPDAEAAVRDTTPFTKGLAARTAKGPMAKLVKMLNDAGYRW